MFSREFLSINKELKSKKYGTRDVIFVTKT